MITFITPVAPEHVNRFENAVDSVNAQSVACRHLYEVDYKREGPGVLRNRLLTQVTTKYVSFLDADDWIEPTFAEACLKAITPGRYVYTDWYEGDDHKRAPAKAWCGGTWHLVTSVVHTADARRVGGFDESLRGMEDTDFYLKFVTRMICGVRVAEPLVHYRANGGRSVGIKNSGEMSRIQEELSKRYGNIMGCCGNQTIISREPVNEKQAGDVQAMALWRGNRVQRSVADASRIYKRGSYPRIYWVNPRDLALDPQNWQEVVKRIEFVEPEIIEPPKMEVGTLSGLSALAAQLVSDGELKPAPPVVEKTDGKIDPDFENVVNLAYRSAKR